MTNGWTPTSLGEILRLEKRPVKLIPEQEYAEIGIYSYGRGIFHKRPRTGFEVGDKDLFEIKNGDFIFQITFAWEGAIALASEAENGMYGSVRFPTYRVNEEICYPKFLVHYFKTEEGRREVGRISPGSAGRNRVLATKRLPEIFVPLPPLTEQRRIVEHIESLARRVNEAQSLREEADREAKILSLSSRNKAFGEIENSPIKKLGDLSIIVRGSSPRPKGDLRFYGGNVPRLLIADVSRDGKYVTPQIDFLTEDGAKLSRPMVKGSLVIAISGSYGIPAFLAVDACIHDGFIGFRDIDPAIDLEYLYQVLLYSKPYFDSVVKNSGLQNLTTNHLKNLDVPVPPLDEQRRIVAYLDGLQAKVNVLRELQSRSGEEMSALMPSILDKAFKGEL